MNVPAPDDVDLWIHNHNVLNRTSWVILLLGFWSIMMELHMYTLVFLILWIGSRGMSRLLCGWVHNWAQYQLEFARLKA